LPGGGGRNTIRGVLRVALPACLLLSIAALSTSCSEDPARAGKPEIPLDRLTARPPKPAFDVSTEAPTAAERLDFYLKVLERGDEDEMRWVRGQLARAGDAAVRPLGDGLRAAFGHNLNYALNILQTFRDPVSGVGALPEILIGAEHANGRVREDAARALGGTGSPDAVAPLLDLTSDPVDQVARAAVEELLELGLEEGGRGLLGRYPDRIDPGARILAVRAIGRLLPRPDAVAFLRARLEGESPVILLTAAGELLDLGETDGVAVARKVFDEDDGTTGLAYPAREVLARARDPGTVALLVKDSSSKTLVVAIVAVAQLGEYRSDEARKALWLAARSADAELKRKALFSLHRSGDPDAMRHIARLLRSTEWSDRLVAILVLGAIGDEETAPLVIAALEKEDHPGVLLKHVSGLGLIGGKGSALALARAMGREPSSDPGAAFLANQAARGLLRFDPVPDDAIRILVELSRSENPAIRLNAAKVLGRRSDGDVTAERLSALLSDPSADVKRTTLRAWLAFDDADVAGLANAYESEEDREIAGAILRAALLLSHRWRQ